MLGQSSSVDRSRQYHTESEYHGRPKIPCIGIPENVIKSNQSTVVGAISSGYPCSSQSGVQQGLAEINRRPVPIDLAYSGQPLFSVGPKQADPIQHG